MAVQNDHRVVHAPLGVGLIVGLETRHDSDDESRFCHDLREMVGDRNAGASRPDEAHDGVRALQQETRQSYSA